MVALAPLALLLSASLPVAEARAAGGPWDRRAVQADAPVAVARALPADGRDAGPGDGCLLGRAEGERATAERCARCHAGHRAAGHPVDLDYAAFQARSGGALRTEAEVVGRGGFLPDGMLRCTSCHDRRSPWAARVMLPPGAVVLPSHAPAKVLAWASGAAERRALPPPSGSSVSPRPLCLLCHALD
jgi:hypothetical protein